MRIRVIISIVSFIIINYISKEFIFKEKRLNEISENKFSLKITRYTVLHSEFINLTKYLARLNGFYSYHIFKPGVHGLRLHVPGFLKLLWFVCRYVCVFVCLCVRPQGINDQWRDMV